MVGPQYPPYHQGFLQGGCMEAENLQDSPLEITHLPTFSSATACHTTTPKLGKTGTHAQLK